MTELSHEWGTRLKDGGDPRPGLAEQSGAASREYAAAALHDPTRMRELEPLLTAFARTWAAAGETRR